MMRRFAKKLTDMESLRGRVRILGLPIASKQSPASSMYVRTDLKPHLRVFMLFFCFPWFAYLSVTLDMTCMVGSSTWGRWVKRVHVVVTYIRYDIHSCGAYVALSLKWTMCFCLG